MKRGHGFTLIEILLVVGLVGIIASAALAPLVFTVRSLEEAQADWGRSHSTSAAADRIYSDLRRVIPNPSFGGVKIIHKSGFGDLADDRLVMWSSAPKYEGREAGVVVYKVVRRDGFSAGNAKPGLYRWVKLNLQSRASVSGDLSAADADEPSGPMEIDTETLEPKDGRLILADAQGIGFFVRSGDRWEQGYDGELPSILKTEIKMEKGLYSRTERFPNGKK